MAVLLFFPGPTAESVIALDYGETGSTGSFKSSEIQSNAVDFPIKYEGT